MDGEKIAMRFGDFHSRRLAEYLDLTDHGGMLRVSMVHYNTVEEVDRFIAALEKILSTGTGLAKAS
jgi:selenocysteine lyase/cysteine desulfurase